MTDNSEALTVCRNFHGIKWIRSLCVFLPTLQCIGENVESGLVDSSVRWSLLGWLRQGSEGSEVEWIRISSWAKQLTAVLAEALQAPN